MRDERLEYRLNAFLLVLAAGAIGCGSSAGQPAGGTGGSSGNVDAGTDSATGGFVLSWQEDFDTLDATAWQLQTFTFGGNEAQFTPQNAAVANGVLTISLT